MLGLPMKTPGVCYKSTLNILPHIFSWEKRRNNGKWKSTELDLNRCQYRRIYLYLWSHTVCAVALFSFINVKKICCKNNSITSLSRWQPACHKSKNKHSHKHGYNHSSRLSHQISISGSHTEFLSKTSLLLQRDGGKGERAGSRWMMIIQAHCSLLFLLSPLIPSHQRGYKY